MDNELMHYGVIGMKWGQHKAAKAASTAALYKRNKTISDNVRNNRRFIKQKDPGKAVAKYAFNKYSQYTVRRSDRAKMYKNIDKKNTAGKTDAQKAGRYALEYVKASLKTSVKDTAMAGSIMMGAGVIAGPIGASVATGGVAVGIAASRIYNTVNNK